MTNYELSYVLPVWLLGFIESISEMIMTPEEQMRLVIDLSNKNVEHSTGGPFAAGIFHPDSKEIISIGLNFVTRYNCSVLHAEIVAIMFAQKKFNDYDLADRGLVMATSSEPCDMCLGAIRWSGIRKLICGARREDVEAIGFKEGFSSSVNPDLLEKEGFSYVRDVLRQEACKVLRNYSNIGKRIYNPDIPINRKNRHD